MEVLINDNTLELKVGDITKQETDVIVNAANGTLLGGGGVDGAIHRAAGGELLAACKEIRRTELAGEELPTGEAVVTKGYNLPAKYVIHTVGPIWNEREEDASASLLADCYQNAFNLAVKKAANSISFPSISTGVYRFPIERASVIALETIVQFLNNQSFGKAVMVLFSEDDFQVYQTALAKIMEE